MSTNPQTGVDAGESSIQPRVVSQDPGVHAVLTDRQWYLPLPYTAPPLTANQRHNIWQRARITKEVRHAAGFVARGRGVPALLACRVDLYYVPRDRRRRDADNLVPTLKASCDGLVDAGVVPDDTPHYMAKVMPTILPAATRPGIVRLYLVVTDLSGVGR